MKKTYKKLFFLSVGFLTVAVLSLVVLTYTVDPCNIYSFRNEYQLCAERNANPGRISYHLYERSNFDSLVAGSSVSQNFLESDVRHYLGWERPMRLFISGYFIGEMDAMLRYALKSGKIKKVLWGIDSNRYESRDESVVWRDFSTFPLYLYDRNKLNDFKYLISNSSFSKMLELLNKKRIKRKNFPKSDNNDTFSFWAADAVNTRNAFNFNQSFFDQNRSLVNAWVPKEQDFPLAEKYIVNLAKDFPEVTFYLFFPPYIYASLSADFLDLRSYLVRKTAGLENVLLFDFADQEKVSANTAYYRDSGHYNANISTAILKSIGQGKGRLTMQNMAQKQAELRAVLAKAKYIRDFPATTEGPAVFKVENHKISAKNAEAVFSTGRRKYEFAKTYVLALNVLVPDDGFLDLSWEPEKRRSLPVRVALKKGENELFFVLTFIPNEQEITFRFQSGQGEYIIKKLEISKQKETF